MNKYLPSFLGFQAGAIETILFKIIRGELSEYW
jgi:hypothetical protein